MIANIVPVALCLGVLCVSAAPPAAEPSGGLWQPMPPFAYGGAGTAWMPPWIANAPWMPQWVPTCTSGVPSCNDCTTRVVCTKIGGLLRPCNDAALPHCNKGVCEATPSTECAAPPAPAAPAPANAPPAVSA